MVSRIVDFVRTDVWRIPLGKMPRRKSFFIRQLRIILLAFRGFDENKCQLRASALTFYTLLSVVPVVAMAFGVAKGFGFEKLLEAQLMERLPGQEEVVGRIITFAQTLLDNTRGGMIAGIGVAVLFWAVIKVLGNIERSFNDIWGIEKDRPLGRKFADYLSVMLVCPVLVIVASSLTVFITTQVTLITERVALLGVLSGIISLSLKLLPYAVIWILFSFVYVFMPNTKVTLRSGILAGIVAGTIYQAVQWIYITFQVGMAKYNAIYGSFAALPLFLVWLQLSWLIILFGAEICFAHQNVETYEFEPDCLRVSRGFRTLLSLQITHLLVRNFREGLEPATATGLSRALDIPVRLVHQILDDLVKSGILSETRAQEDKETAYQPGRSTENLTIACVIDALARQGTDRIPVARTPELAALAGSLESFRETVEQSPANKLLREL
ncbi:MAG: YihY/virulence factor BrkB family protein [Phycisphaerae bacterium]|nr:YihY/virulence factor BrkB family protein [Phycisphaerae bacterium]